MNKKDKNALKGVLLKDVLGLFIRFQQLFK